MNKNPNQLTSLYKTGNDIVNIIDRKDNIR